jgi:hypothetical protein
VSADHDAIDSLLRKGITIIEDQITKISKLNSEILQKQDADKLTNYLSCLVSIRKDWRASEKDASINVSKMTAEELEQAIIDEAEKLKAK